MSSSDSDVDYRTPRYRGLPLAVYVPRTAPFQDVDNVTILNLPITLLPKIVSAEVELCKKFVPKSPSLIRRCCVIDHPVYVYIKNDDKLMLVWQLMRKTSHLFLHASTKPNVFLGTPSPRRCTLIDFVSACRDAGIEEFDVEVYGQKASLTSYEWLRQLPSTSITYLDLGRYYAL